MVTNNVTLFNTDPNVQQQAALIQQRQALAQALLQQGMTPLDTSNRQIGGVAYHVSPFEGLAKLAQTYVGRKGIEQATQDQANLAAQAYGNLLQRYQPGGQITPDQVSQASQNALSQGAQEGSVGPTQANAQRLGQAIVNTPTPVNPNNPIGLPAELLAGHAMGIIPDKVLELQAARYAPTPATVQALQGGMNPVTANQQTFQKSVTDPEIYKLQQAGFSPQQIQQYFAAKNAKENIMAARPDQSLYQFGPDGQPQLAAVAPNPQENMQFQVGPGGGLSAQPVPGAVPAVAGMAGPRAGAVAAAQAPYNVVETYDPMTNAPTKGYAGNLLPRPGYTVPGAIQQARGAQGAPVQGPQVPQGGGVQSGPSLGQPDQLKRMGDRWGQLQSDNSSAQQVKYNLGQIGQLAQKAAVGPFTDKLQYVNALLSTVGGNEKATDAVTANNLLDKYQSQIVAKLGQGGLGTDAARSILQAAYPSAHMTPQAIQEAVTDLNAATDVTMAKARLLQPLATNRNAPQYEQTETKFDQNADPRLFKLQSMSPQQAQAFLQKLSPQEQQSLRTKLANLKQMGVF